MLTVRERLKRAMNFQPVDRLPILELCPWWDKTLARWQNEGFPQELDGDCTIRRYFGLDPLQELVYFTYPPGASCALKDKTAGQGTDVVHTSRGGLWKESDRPVVQTVDDYLQLKENLLYPETGFYPDELHQWKAKHERGEVVLTFDVGGFFWHPRQLFGIESHLYAFYDEPELMHMMCRDLLNYHLRTLPRVFEVLKPDFVMLNEDMSYRGGPMLSEQCFNEFLAPYYRKLVPFLQENDVPLLVDSDGDFSEMIPWLLAVGVDGWLPLERRAGVDIVELRNRYPKLRLIGGYDKLVMSEDRTAMAEEFERILPAMRQGGFVPSCDHQTPPAVSMANYRIYVDLLRQYCEKAVA